MRARLELFDYVLSQLGGMHMKLLPCQGSSGASTNICFDNQIWWRKQKMVAQIL
jgi:hypothetical protein